MGKDSRPLNEAELQRQIDIMRSPYQNGLDLERIADTIEAMKADVASLRTMRARLEAAEAVCERAAALRSVLARQHGRIVGIDHIWATSLFHWLDAWHALAHPTPATGECLGEAPKSVSAANALQRAVAVWHENRFPTADAVLVGLKAAAELGELAEAIHSRAPDSPGVRGEVGSEAADVAICLFTICERWFGVDLLEEVKKKLAVLNDPNSGHRSAALPPVPSEAAPSDGRD